MSTKTKIKKSEIKPGCAKTYQIQDEKIVVCNIDNRYYAVSDVCSHDDGELVSGEDQLVEQCQLQCPRHGARFNVTTGEATKMPAVAPIKTYKITVSEDELEIKLDE